MTEKRLTADPKSLKFLQELLAIAESSDLAMDRAVAEGLRRMIELKKEEIENENKKE